MVGNCTVAGLHLFIGRARAIVKTPAPALLALDLPAPVGPDSGGSGVKSRI
jgi:hypothetical protein